MQGQDAYRYIFASHPHPMWILDRQTLIFLEVNQAAIEKYGFSRPEFLQMTIEDICPPDELPRLLENLAQPHLESAWSQGWHNRLKDGSLIDVSIASRTLQFNGHDAVLVIAEDITGRMRTEKASLVNEARYRSLFDQTHDAVFILDLNGNLILANQRAADMLGYTLAEMQTLSVNDVSAEMTKTGTLMVRLVAGEQIPPYERLFRKKNGEIFPVEISPELVWDFNGNPRHIQSVVRDITERKRAEEALRASEDRYHDLIEKSNDLICTHDLDGKLLTVNEAAARMSGYSRQELLQMNLADLLTPRTRRFFSAYLNKMRTSGHARGLMQIQMAGGETRTWEYNNTLRVEGGAAPIVRGMAHDITERKRAERALRESQTQLQGIFNTMMDAVITVDDDQKIVIFNPAAEQMFKSTAGEAIGQALDRFLPEYIRAEHREFIQAFGQSASTKRSMKTSSLALTCLRANGESFPSDVSISQIEIDGKKLYTAIVRDITERKRAEEALRESEERFSRLAQAGFEGIAIHEQGRIQDANQALADLFGYELTEIIGMNALDLAAPGSRKLIGGNIAAGFEKPYEADGLRKDGTLFACELVGKSAPYQGRMARVTAIRDISGRKQAEQRLKRNVEELNAIHQSALAMQKIHSLDELTPEIIGILEGTLNYEYGAVLLIEENTGRLLPYAVSGQKQDPKSAEADKAYIRSFDIHVGQGITGWVAQNGKSLRIDDVKKDVRYRQVREAICSEMCVPLMVGDQVIGVINIETIKPNAFTEADQRVLETVAAQIAAGIRNARLFEALRDLATSQA